MHLTFSGHPHQFDQLITLIKLNTTTITTYINIELINAKSLHRYLEELVQ